MMLSKLLCVLPLVPCRQRSLSDKQRCRQADLQPVQRSPLLLSHLHRSFLPIESCRQTLTSSLEYNRFKSHVETSR